MGGRGRCPSARSDQNVQATQSPAHWGRYRCLSRSGLSAVMVNFGAQPSLRVPVPPSWPCHPHGCGMCPASKWGDRSAAHHVESVGEAEGGERDLVHLVAHARLLAALAESTPQRAQSQPHLAAYKYSRLSAFTAAATYTILNRAFGQKYSAPAQRARTTSGPMSGAGLVCGASWSRQRIPFTIVHIKIGVVYVKLYTHEQRDTISNV